MNMYVQSIPRLIVHFYITFCTVIQARKYSSSQERLFIKLVFSILEGKKNEKEMFMHLRILYGTKDLI